MLGAEELHLPDSELKTPATRARWLSLLYTKRWVLYAKRPFGGPQQVLRYLANYTHRVALSNRRIVAVDVQQQSVTFTYRDYRHGSQLSDFRQQFNPASQSCRTEIHLSEIPSSPSSAPPSLTVLFPYVEQHQGRLRPTVE